ncbi:MAG: adaptor protein MecA [Lachnospiraceae bacterium]|nr:adaptor protein MecA [Lachnospiraceae bacterium]
MKIEKINDYQIRCTLTREDLIRRDMKVSELAYGTDKARALFQDMMEQAYDSFGFEAEDMPLMIEAIPWASDCLVLIITKCDDPEELDTRFANFAPSVYIEDPDTYDEEEDDFSSLFSRIQEGGMSGLFQNEQPGAKKVKKKVGGGKSPSYSDDAAYRIFSFDLLMDVIAVAARVDSSYGGKNTLYRHKDTGRYMLVLHRQNHKKDNIFAQTCLTVSEYGTEEPAKTASEQYLGEHGEIVIRDHALQVLKQHRQ